MATPPKEKDTPFDISIWRRASAKNSQAQERQRLHTLDEVWKAIEQLSQTYQWEDLYLFGSITKSQQFSDRSDIDIGIKGLHKLLHYRFTADLSTLILKEVDVVRFEDCSFADTIKSRGIRWKKKK